MMEIIGGILGDCLSVKGVPTGAAGAAIGKMISKRHNLLREVIRSELRQGNFENIDQDELVSIFFRLIRDAEEGVARNNLRLMARIIKGMAEKGALKAPSFMKYANVLASLTEDEIKVLAVMAQLNWATFMPYETRKQFIEVGIENYQAIQQALLRTGLVTLRLDARTIPEKPEMRRMYGASDKVDANQIFTLTPLFSEIEMYLEAFNLDREAA